MGDTKVGQNETENAAGRYESIKNHKINKNVKQK
jgi:hypothetical protein